MNRTYTLTLTSLAPLHIGTGRELQRNYDYVVRDKRTWMLNPDALLERMVDARGVLDERLVGRPASELLTADDFRPGSPIFRTVLFGTPQSGETGTILREQLKDVFGGPYLPGSSIKGALRTLLAWQGYHERSLVLDPSSMSRRNYAAQSIERTLFGHDPTHDLLRALRVADSAPLPPAALRIVNARVFTGAPQLGSPIDLEAIAPDQTLTTTVSIDPFLWSAQAEPELHFAARRAWLEQLPAIGRAWATQQLRSEIAWFSQRAAVRIVQLYQQMLNLLEKQRLSPAHFFMQIGWGGGWGSKTIGAPLRANPARFEQLLADRQLSPARMRRHANDPFPRSRRVLIDSSGPAAPFGWCLVEMKEKR